MSDGCLTVGVVSCLYHPDEVGGYERLCRDVVQRLACTELAGQLVEVRVLTRFRVGLPEADVQDGVVVERRLVLNRSEDFYTVFSEDASQRHSRVRKNGAVLRNFISGVDLLFVWGVAGLDRETIDELRVCDKPIVWYVADDHLPGVVSPHAAWFQKRKALRVGANVRRLGLVHRTSGDTPSRILPLQFYLPGSIIYCSEFIRTYCEALGVRGARTVVLRHDIIIDESAKTNPDSSLIPVGRIGVVFASRLVPEKDPITALRGLAMLPSSLLRRVALVIVGTTGEGSMSFEIDQLLGRIADKGALVSQVAWLPISELRSLLRRSEIFVFTSKYEPYALTLLEAMTAGMAIIASAAGGNSEVIRNWRTGILVRPGSAVGVCASAYLLVVSKRLRQWFGSNAKAARSDSSFDSFLEAIKGVLSAAINGGNAEL